MRPEVATTKTLVGTGLSGLNPLTNKVARYFPSRITLTTGYPVLQYSQEVRVMDILNFAALMALSVLVSVALSVALVWWYGEWRTDFAYQQHLARIRARLGE